ncbi:MAG: Na+/H+ antiporter subunit E [Burkholderiaceae bacterium]
MKRLFPAPWLSFALFALWLALNHSTSPAQLLMGVIVGVGVPWLSAPLRPQRGGLSSPLVLLRLIAHVGLDVIAASLLVARGVLSLPRRDPRSAFVTIPLQMRSTHGLAALAVITTVTPGTVWCVLAHDGGWLMLHVFDVSDEADFIAHYKQRYERPLMEIFE